MPALPMKYDDFGIGKPAKRFNVESSRSIGMAMARFWKDV